MVIYRNDYNKKTDKMMWELHDIRHKMQKEGLSPTKINNNAQKIINNWAKKRKNVA